MYKIQHQAKAKTDLKEIWLYSFENHGERQADKYYDDLICGIDTISNNPHAGVACDYIRSGYRQYKINKHFIFYRVVKDSIQIVRVLHESMKVENHF